MTPVIGGITVGSVVTIGTFYQGHKNDYSIFLYCYNTNGGLIRSICFNDGGGSSILNKGQLTMIRIKIK